MELDVPENSEDKDKSDILKLAIQQLKESKFSEAKIFIEELIKNDNENAMAWLVKLSIENENYSLYEYLLDDEQEYEEFYITDFNTNTIFNAIKYIKSDKIKNKLYDLLIESIFYTTYRKAVSSEELDYIETLSDFMMANRAEEFNDAKDQLWDQLIENYVDEEEKLHRFFEKLLKFSYDKEDYNEYLALFARSFIRKNDFKNGKKYNDILLSEDENSADGYVNNCLIETKSSSLWDYGRKTSIELDTELIKDKIAHSDKESAEKLIELFTSREEALFEFGIYDEARELFDLIKLYEFRSKQDFLIQNAKIFSRGVLEVDITEGELDDFIEKILSQITDKTKRCECINNIAEAYLKVENFDAAYDYAMKSLECESDYNHKARWTLLLAELKCTDGNEFVYNSNFSKDMENYQALLLAAQNDEKAIERYTDLAQRNIDTQNLLYNRKESKIRKAKLKLKKCEKAIKPLIIIGVITLAIFAVISAISVYLYWEFKLVFFYVLIPLICFYSALMFGKKAKEFEAIIDGEENKQR